MVNAPGFDPGDAGSIPAAPGSLSGLDFALTLARGEIGKHSGLKSRRAARSAGSNPAGPTIIALGAANG